MASAHQSLCFNLTTPSFTMKSYPLTQEAQRKKETTEKNSTQVKFGELMLLIEATYGCMGTLWVTARLKEKEMFPKLSSAYMSLEGVWSYEHLPLHDGKLMNPNLCRSLLRNQSC